MKRNKGKLFIIEGIDYSGKSTIINSLKKDFPEIIFTREPGGTIAAEEIRNILLSIEGKSFSDLKRLELFFKARKIHLEEKILPAIESGKVVISDRFDASTFAYQVRSKELEDRFWKLRYDLNIHNINLEYLYLSISAKESLRRKAYKHRNDIVNHFDLADQLEVEKRVSGYNKFFSKIKNLKIINGEVELVDVYRAVQSIILKELAG